MINMQVLNAQQKQLFKDVGILKLKGFLPLNYIQTIQNEFNKEFNEVGLLRDGEWFLEGITMNDIRKILKKVKSKKIFSNFLLEAKTRQAICELLDDDEAFSMSRTVGVLFTLPDASEWEVPSDAWHIDIPRLPYEGSLGIQVFSFVETLESYSGATLAIKGSHNLFNADKLSSKNLRNKLVEFSYFKKLMSKDFEDRSWFTANKGKILGKDVELIELFGNIGDIYLMDIRILHSVAPNPGPNPRIMVAQRYLSEKVRKHYNIANIKPN